MGWCFTQAVRHITERTGDFYLILPLQDWICGSNNTHRQGFYFEASAVNVSPPYTQSVPYRKLYDLRRCSVALSCLRAGRANVEDCGGFVGLNRQDAFFNALGYPCSQHFECFERSIARSCACFFVVKGVPSQNGFLSARDRWRILLLQQILAAERRWWRGRAPRCRWRISAGRPELSPFGYWSGKSSRARSSTWTLCWPCAPRYLRRRRGAMLPVYQRRS